MDSLAVNSFQLLVGGLLALLVSFSGWRLGWLDLSGSLAAFGMGLIVFGLGGISWSIVLMVFFVSSSLLSKLFKGRKAESEAYAAKGAKRDAGQVLANGGIASLFVLVHLFFPNNWLPWIGFVAAFAAANADTWATEIGMLSKNPPRMLGNGKLVVKGTSGGVSLTGTLGAAAGAGLVALTAWAVWPWNFGSIQPWFIVILFLAGLAGSFVDSYLGATVQRVNYCPACRKETEKTPLHSCGAATEYRRGWRWMNNDWVNLFCTISAAVIALFLTGAFPIF